MGRATIGSISIVIGLTSWFGIAKIIRTEVRQLRSSEYVIAAKCMGGSFWHILWKHLAPNFVSSIMFMVVMNVRSAIVAESTLSFLGIGLPLDVISWGSMLSLAEKALRWEKNDRNFAMNKEQNVTMWNGCARWSDISKRIAICAFSIRTDAKIAVLFL